MYCVVEVDVSGLVTSDGRNLNFFHANRPGVQIVSGNFNSLSVAHPVVRDAYAPIEYLNLSAVFNVNVSSLSARVDLAAVVDGQ